MEDGDIVVLSVQDQNENALAEKAGRCAVLCGVGAEIGAAADFCLTIHVSETYKILYEGTDVDTSNIVAKFIK